MTTNERTWRACVATTVYLRTTDPGVLAYHERDLYMHDRAALAHPVTRRALWVVYRSGTHLGWIPEDPPDDATARDLRVWRDHIAELSSLASLWVNPGYFPGAHAFVLDTEHGQIESIADVAAWLAREIERADARLYERREAYECAIRRILALD